MDMDPYTTFVYGIRSPYTKESYCGRLRGGFFDAINLRKDKTLNEHCNSFVHKGRADPNWALNNILRSLHYMVAHLIWSFSCKEEARGIYTIIIVLRAFLEIIVCS